MSLAAALRARLARTLARLAFRGAGEIDPRRHQPPLPLPSGYGSEELLEAMVSLTVGSGAPGELEAYARIDFERFVQTLGLLPDGQDLRGLEIGAGPYFTTLLVRWFRPRITLELTNYFGGPVSEQVAELATRHPRGGVEQFEFRYWNVDIEAQRVPVEDARYDLVLFCEVLEHLTHDPLAALLEIKRVLKPDGLLVLSTPNVARLENVARLIVGQNLYDPYSAYGPHGRHNREYSQHELHHLLTHAGFVPERMFSADTHHNGALALVPAAKLRTLLGWRASSLGQYLFCVARNARPADTRKPSWLYRSFPPDQAVERAL